MKNFRFILAILLLLSVNTTLLGNEWANYYFPRTPGNYWVYEDQNGDTLTRYAIEDEKIDGDSYHAFSYEPALEDWADFEHYVHPYFYQISDDWVAFFVGDEFENAFKAKTTRQMEATKAMAQQLIMQQMPPELNVTVDFDFDIEVDSQDYFYFLPTPATRDEEWTAMEASVVTTMVIDIKGLPPGLPGGAGETLKSNAILIETGNVTGTETVETAAGTFEECLVIEYRVDTSAETSMPIPGVEGPVEQEDVIVTTLWLAPNVGIVKFESMYTVPPEGEEFDLGMEMPEDRTLELIQYEIQSSNSEVNE